MPLFIDCTLTTVYGAIASVFVIAYPITCLQYDCCTFSCVLIKVSHSIILKGKPSVYIRKRRRRGKGSDRWWWRGTGRRRRKRGREKGEESMKREERRRTQRPQHSMKQGGPHRDVDHDKRATEKQ